MNTSRLPYGHQVRKTLAYWIVKELLVSLPILTLNRMATMFCDYNLLGLELRLPNKG